MSYEKFITDFLNIKPSDLSKISTSTGSDGSVFIRIRLSKKSVLCPYCNGNAKVKVYYDRKLTHSTFSNRICYIIKAKVCADSFHVLKHLTDDFRKVRIKCQNSTENPTLKHLLVKFNKAFDHKYQNSLDNEPRYNKKLGRYINYRGIRD